MSQEYAIKFVDAAKQSGISQFAGAAIPINLLFCKLSAVSEIGLVDKPIHEPSEEQVHKLLDKPLLDKPIHEPSILIVNIQQQPNYTEFVKQIKDKKDIVFHKDNIPVNAAPIDNLEAKNVNISLCTENIDGYPSLAILNDKNWKGINFDN